MNAEVHDAVEAPERPSSSPWHIVHGVHQPGSDARSTAQKLADEAWADASPARAARRLLAEGFGTFALVFAAAGADTIARVTGGAVSDAARAVAPALMVGALIYAVADTSGAHFNPAVTLSFTLKGLFPARWLPGYWLAQLLGAVVAAAVLRLLFGEAAVAGVSTPHTDLGTALVVEAILTVLLVSVVLGTADRARLVGPNAAMAVAGTIALCGLVALPLEGASMNPARSLGPALVNGQLDDVWVYVLGPVVGALIATGLMHLLHGSPDGTKQREAARGSTDRGTPPRLSP